MSGDWSSDVCSSDLREATRQFWESYWKARCAVWQYKRRNLDQETYQELWEDVVRDWIKILFAESGHFGRQMNLSIEGQERTAAHCYIVAWARHRRIQSQSMWDNLQEAIDALEDLNLLGIEFLHPSPTP